MDVTDGVRLDRSSISNVLSEVVFRRHEVILFDRAWIRAKEFQPLPLMPSVHCASL